MRVTNRRSSSPMNTVNAARCAFMSSSSDTETGKDYTFTITDRTDASIRDAVSGAQAKVQENLRSAVGVFQSVSLTAGQTLRCEAGAEILLLSGSAVTAGPFSDVTTGESMAAGAAIEANHLLLAGEDEAALQANDAVRLLVRGGCTLAG